MGDETSCRDKNTKLMDLCSAATVLFACPLSLRFETRTRRSETGEFQEREAAAALPSPRDHGKVTLDEGKGHVKQREPGKSRFVY